MQKFSAVSIKAHMEHRPKLLEIITRALGGFIIVLSTLAVPASGADFKQGLTAFAKGDYATALLEWTPLAEGGGADAQFLLGYMYDVGQGIPQDYATALKWYQLAGRQGNAMAQTNLGVMYYQGKGVSQDYKAAVKWYRMAAQQKDANAQFRLSLCYQTGHGVPEDKVLALMWAHLASANGHKSAPSARDDLLRGDMTSDQLDGAQRLARECISKNYRRCD